MIIKNKMSLAEKEAQNLITIKEAEAFTGKSAAFINKAIKLYSVMPIAGLDSGKAGRPSKLFAKQELLNCISNFVADQSHTNINQEEKIAKVA